MLPTAALVLAVLLIPAGSASPDPPNMVANPGFENGAEQDGLPADWRLWVGKGGKAECAVDTGVHRSGEASARVSAGSDVQALLLSKAIPVAVGESFEVSAWFRGEGFASDSDGGRAAFTVAFLDQSGRFARLVRLGKPIESGDWQRLGETVEVPEGISDMLIEAGLGMAHGTVWVDDVSIAPRSAFAVRPAKPNSDLSPGTVVLPIQIINRAAEKRTVRLVVECSGRRTEMDVTLDGSALQVAEARIEPPKPGGVPINLRLLDPASSAELAASTYAMRVLPPVDMEPPTPTHFCIEDPEPTAEVRIWNNLPPEQVEKITVTLASSSGDVLARRVITEVGSAPIDVRLASSKVSLGDYLIRSELRTKTGEIHTRMQPWRVIHRSQARVTLDSQGFPVSDGKRVYVLGTFNSGRYDLMKKTRFTITHAWNRVNLPPEGQRITHQSVMDFLEDTHKAGLRAVLLIRHFAERGAWDECRRRVRMFRNHPALLAWVEEEEVARGQIKIGDLERYVSIIREEDPNHPFVLADSYTEITAVDRSRFFRNDLMDIGMWWYYPIPLGAAGLSAALEGQDPSERGVLPVPSFMLSTKKPVWVGLQAYKKPRHDGRIPTPAEYRCMAYLALIHGAKGLIYYMGGSAARVEGELDPDRPWGYLHELVPELAEMMPVFAQSAGGNVSISPASAPVDAVLKREGDEFTLIALNRGDQALNAILKSTAIPGEVEVLYENRKLKAVHAGLSDRFEPYAVHVYRWRTAGKASSPGAH